MKKVKSFRLEEDVLTIIEQQPNATQFIEDLVRGERGNTPVEDYILETLDKINQKLGAGGGLEKVAPPELKVSIPVSKRTIKDILSDIKVLEAVRDSELEYCQDPDTFQEIGNRYGEQIQTLWDEYHTLKNNKVE